MLNNCVQNNLIFTTSLIKNIFTTSIIKNNLKFTTLRVLVSIKVNNEYIYSNDILVIIIHKL
jgi:hypothetical protein